MPSSGMFERRSLHGAMVSQLKGSSTEMHVSVPFPALPLPGGVRWLGARWLFRGSWHGRG